MQALENEELFYIDSKKETAAELLACRLKEMLGHTSSPPVFLCIGSDRVTGDSLGPIIGSRLKRAWEKGMVTAVYGTLEAPVHALNLKSTLERIRHQHPDNPVIAIDASLGVREHLGYITISRGSLAPGAGVNKNLEYAGDIAITGITAALGPFSHISLQTTRLSAVIPLAEPIITGILLACETYLSEAAASLS